MSDEFEFKEVMNSEKLIKEYFMMNLGAKLPPFVRSIISGLGKLIGENRIRN